MSRLADPADRLAHGSVHVARRLGTRTAAWVARGRRADLTGWKAVLGPLVRLVVLAFVGWIGWAILRAIPWLMWVLAALWTGAAWRAGRDPKETAVEAPADSPEKRDTEAARAAVLRLLRDLMGDAPGVHLGPVLAHLQEQGQWEGKKVADLRAHLEALRIPVELKLKMRGVPKRGVSRAALDALPPLGAQEESPRMSPAA